MPSLGCPEPRLCKSQRSHGLSWKSAPTRVQINNQEGGHKEFSGTLNAQVGQAMGGKGAYAFATLGSGTLSKIPVPTRLDLGSALKANNILRSPLNAALPLHQLA